MSDITVDFATYLSEAPFNASDFVTLADDSSVLDALTDSQIDGLATNNVDVISATDGVLSWTADQYAHLITGPVAIDPDTFAIMADTGADIAAISASQIGQIAAEGVAVVNPTDGMLALSVAQFGALGAMSVDASADFTIADTGANLASMDAGQIASLSILGVDHLDATDDALSLSVAQYQALGTVALTAGDDVTLADTGANLEALSVDDIGNLGAGGVDHIDATDNVLTISLAEFNALGTVTLTQSDTVTLADTGAAISSLGATDIDALATGGVDILDATDDAIAFTVAQYNETIADNIALTPTDTVTLADSGANLAGLTAADINSLVNVDAFDATDDVLTIGVDQFQALEGKNITLAAGDTVTVSDTAANIATLGFADLASAHVDFLDSTTAYTTLTVSDLAALGTVAFTAASAVTLTDTGANIASVSDFSTFAAHGVDTLDASDDVLTISEAQFQALGTTTLTGADTVTISDTAANIVGGPNYATLAAAGIDFLDATTAISVTVNDITNLGTVVFTAASAVKLADTGAHIAAVANFATFATHGVDVIDASNNTLTINATQFAALGTVMLTAADTVTISDTAAHLSGLTFSALAGANVDFLNSTNAYTGLTVQNVADLGAVHFTAASNVTLTDSAADIQAVSDFTTFATHGVDTIKSSDNALSLTVSQYSGLGTTHLTTADAVTLADAASNLTTYFAGFGSGSALGTALSDNGVDSVHATGGSLSVNGLAALGVFDGGATFLSADTVTLADTGDTIAVALSNILSHGGHPGTLGIDIIDATDNALNLTAAEYLDIAGNVALTAADTVTIADTEANVAALTAVQIGALSANLVDAVSVTSGGDLDWSVAQWQALPGGVSISDAGNALVVSDSESNIEALTGTQLGALAASGAQELDATNGTLNLSVSQAEGFLGTGLSIASGDTATLVDTGANIAGLTATQLGQLAAAGFATIDASDDALTLDAAQLSALGTVHLTDADAVTLADTASDLDAFLDGANANAALFDNGVDTIHATGGTLSVDAQAVNSVIGTGAVFASGDTVTLADTGANIAALNFSTLAGIHIDGIDATDNTLSISLDQYNAIAGTVALAAGDNVTVTGNLDDLSTTDIAAFGTNHVDHLLDNDGFSEVIWTVAQWDALATNVTVDNYQHIAGLNFVFDGASELSAVTATQVADFVAEGAQTWEVSPAGDESLVSWTVTNTEAMGGSVFSDETNVSVVDSAANIEAVTDFSIFAAHKIDSIDSTDDTLTLTVAQFSGLGTTTLTGSDAVTLADTAANLNTYLDGSGASEALSSNGVDTIHATGGAISIDANAVNHVAGAGAVFASGDTVTLADTGANIESLDFSQLGGLQIDTIDATDNTLSISLGQYEDVAGVVAFTTGDTVTVTGNVDDLSTTEIASFATNHVDHVLDADGFNEVIWNVAQWNALTTAVTIDNYQHIGGLNFVFDSGANLSAVTAAQVANFVAEGAEVFEGQPPGQESVTWNVAKLEAMGAAVWTSTDVTVSDSAANIEAVSDFSTFAAHGITTIDSTDDALSLTTAQYSALGSTGLTGSDTVTIADTAANLTSYLGGFADSNSISGALSANGVDIIHATDGTLSVTGTEAAGVFDSGAAFAAGDAVTVADTGANIAAFIDHVQGGTGDLGVLGIDTFDATDDVLTLTVSEYSFALDGGVAFTAADTVTIADTASNLEALTDTQIGALSNVDAISVISGGDLDWSVAQWQALPGGVALSVGADNSTALLVVDDDQAVIQALGHADIAALVAQGAQELASTDGVLNLTVDQVTGFLGTTLSAASGDTVTIADTQANIDALTVTQLGELADSGIDHIFATDGSVTFSVAQFDALGTVTVAAGNTFTVADSEANIEALGADGYGAMAAAGVDIIHSTGGSLTVTFDEFSAIDSGSTVFAAGDHVTLTGTQEELFDTQSSDFFAALGAIGIDEISLTGDGIGHLSVSQWNALVTVSISLDSANTITLEDTASVLSGENASAIAAMSGQIDSWAASDTGTLTLSVAQLNALATATIALTPADTIELSDSEANIEVLNAAALKGFVDQGVDIVHATGGTLSLDTAQVAAILDNGATFVSADSVTLTDNASTIAGLTAGQWGELVAGHVDAITATGGTLGISVAELRAVETALHDGDLTLTNAAAISDTGTAISALTVTEIGQLAGDNITSLSGTGDIDFTQAQIDALGGVSVSASGYFVLADSAATIEGLSTAAIDNDASAGVNAIHSTDTSDALTFTVAQAQHILSDGMLVSNASVVVSDTGAQLSTLSFAQLNGMGGAGFTGIVDTSGDITWNFAQLDHLTVNLTLNGNGLILSDTEALLEAQNGATWAYIASLATSITASDTHALNLSIGQISPLFGSNATFAAGDTVTLTDTGTDIAAMTAAQFGELAGLHVDAIDASDDTLALSVAQYNALGTVVLTAGDVVTLSDTAANLETLDFSTLAGKGIDAIDATDNALTISAAQFGALGAVALTAGDTVTISDTSTNIAALNFSTLAGKNVDVLDVTNAFSLSVARYTQLGAVVFSPASTITLKDTGAHLGALNVTQIGQLAAHGIDSIDATDNALTLNVAQFNALGTVALNAGDVVTLADTGANLASLDFTSLAAKGVDVLDATDNVLSLTVAKYQALGTVALTAADTVTLADTGAHIAALTVAQIGALAAGNIDKIDASNNVLSLSVAQFGALGGVTLTGADTVTLLDTGANLQTLNFSTLAAKGVDILDASDNVLTLTAAQFQALGTVALKSTDTVTLLDTGADISALSVAQFNALAAKGIDILDATDNAYSLTVAKVEGISPALTLAANDTITVQDSEARIEAMTGAQIAAAVARGIDIFHATNSTLNLSAAQITPLLGSGAAIAAGDTVTLVDTSANIQALSAVQIGELAAAGVDKIDATDNAVTLNIAQYEALGSVQLSAGDLNTLADADNPGLVDLSTTVIAGLGSNHISHIHGTSTFEWNMAQWSALASNITIDTAVGLVRLYDTVANIESLTPTQIATFHTEGLAQLEIATSGAGSELDFSVAQTSAITTAGLTFSTDNASTANPIITDTGAAIAAMTTTQIAAAASDGFTAVNATDDALTFSVAQFTAMGAMSFTGADTVTITDTEASIEALTNGQLASMASKQVDVIHASGGILNMTTAQVGALLATATHFAAGDTVTLVDTGAAIAQLGSAQIGVLAAAGIDSIDASDDTLTLNLAQYGALGTVMLTQADTVTIQDDNGSLTSLSVAEIQALSSNGVDVLESTNGNFSFSVAQTEALIHQTGGGHVSLTTGDTFYVNDTGANISTLTADDLTALGALGAHTVDLLGTGTITINLAFYNAAVAAGVTLDAGDTVTLADTGAALRGLSTTALAALGANGIDAIHATNNAVSFSQAQLDALATASVALTAADTVTFADSATHLQALTAAQITAYIAQGVDVFHTNSGSILVFSESQAAAVLDSTASFMDSDAVTLADTAANLQNLSATELGLLASKGVDIIQITSGTLQLSVADYAALGAFPIVGGTVSLVDTGANIATLTAAQLAALTGTGITLIDATDDALSLTAAQASAVLHQTGSGTVAFGASDTVTIADTGSAIAGMSVADLTGLGSNGAGHVVLDASDNALTITAAQYGAITGSSVALTAADTITLTDTGADLAALNTSQIAALGTNHVDAIDATDNAITFTLAQLGAFQTANVALTAADTITLADTEANIEALTGSRLAAYVAQGVDSIDALNGVLNLGKAQVAGVIATSASFQADNTVTLLDTGANIGSLSVAQFARLSAHGVDFIDASDNALSLSTAQYMNLGTTQLTQADTVTLADTGANLAHLTTAQLQQLAISGVDKIDATDNAVTFTLDGYNALGSVQLAANDVITVNGTAGADTFQGRDGTQVLNGFGGDDTFAVGVGNHTLNGGAGNDTVSYSAAAAGVTINLGTGVATTGAWTDSLSAIENATGSSLHDVITGSDGVNTINGGGGDDTLIGGGKADILTGGAGADTFVYQSTSDSTRTQSDTITDFSHAEGDKIDVSAIADFTFVDHLTHHADQLAVIDMGGGLYQVVGDVNGDGTADFAILVHSSTALVAGDFVL